MKFKTESLILAGIVLVISGVTINSLLGITGLRTVLALILMFFPVYAIFNNFDLEKGEKIIFSFFVSITIFPSLTYWLGFVVPFKISIWITFVILLAAAFAVKRFSKQRKFIPS